MSLDKLIESAFYAILWGAIILLGTLIALGLTACVATDPSQWRPDQHMYMERSCRVMCRPGQVLEYDSMDGSCKCMRIPRAKEGS